MKSNDSGFGRTYLSNNGQNQFFSEPVIFNETAGQQPGSG